jgi:hypothetical protein
MNSEKEKIATEQKPKVNKDVLASISGKWTVKPCKKTWLHNQNPNHDGADIFSGAEIWLPAQRSATNQDIVITGLTEEERLAFEEAMFLQPGTLSPYNMKFWSHKNNQVKIAKGGLKLDCDNNVKHKLWFKVLQASTRVAKGDADLAFNSTAEVVLSSLEHESKIDAQKVVVKSKAYVKFNSMSLQEKMDYLKVYEEGRLKIDSTTKGDLIDQTIGSIIERDPAEFLSTFDNQYYKDYVLLENLISKNIVIRKGGKFFINGGVAIGDSKVQVITNLKSDDFQDTKIGLIAKLEAAK